MSMDRSRKATSERNVQIIKTLLRDPSNKYCADCKTASHPRWASWNLGVFLCIRCSGIHRSMGTHISRVRSVDLDSWSDEQVGSMVKWGNKRANLYWEHKLPPSYIPDDSKINNFIRTKYDLKRWVMSSEIPDPSTLGDLDRTESVPLSEVKSKANGANTQQQLPPPPKNSNSSRTSSSLIPDLLGDKFEEPPKASATTQVQQVGVSNNQQASLDSLKNPSKPLSKSSSNPSPGILGSANGSSSAPTGSTASAKTESLLGLDFSNPSSLLSGGSTNSASSTRPSSAASRPDLKKSILSLYASASPSSQPASSQQMISGASNSYFNSTSTSGVSSGSSGLMGLDMGNSKSNGSLNTGASSGFSNFGSSGQSMTSTTPMSNDLSLTTLKISSNPSAPPASDSVKSDPFSSIMETHSNLSNNVWATSVTNSTTTSNGKSSSTQKTTMVNDDWDSFTSAPPKSSTSIEDDLFSNVWK